MFSLNGITSSGDLRLLNNVRPTLVVYNMALLSIVSILGAMNSGRLRGAVFSM